MNCAREVLFVPPDPFPSLLFCASRWIYTDDIIGFPCPLALVGLSSGEQEIREEKERKVRVFPSQASSLQAACVCHLRAASSTGPSPPGFQEPHPHPFMLVGLGEAQALLLAAPGCCTIPFISLYRAHTFVNSPFMESEHAICFCLDSDMRTYYEIDTGLWQMQI